MINLDRAVSIAKDFLQRTCGYYLYELQEVNLENDKWVVCYKSKPWVYVGMPPYTLYTIELDKENGEIIRFKKSEQKRD